MTISDNTNWSIKYLRDGRYMPFGSMCNAWGQANHGKGVDIPTFLEAMVEIAGQAQKFVEEDIERERKAMEIPEVQLDESKNVDL
jgi:hypothetical protein